jgi:hypothetical protein
LTAVSLEAQGEHSGDGIIEFSAHFFFSAGDGAPKRF